VALSRQAALVDAGRQWWLWTAMAGVALGLVAIAWATWLVRRRQRRDAASAAGSPAGASPADASPDARSSPGA
jgi:uncharacterized SAM-binding protein YcdF (DUF218 family)